MLRPDPCPVWVGGPSTLSCLGFVWVVEHNLKRIISLIFHPIYNISDQSAPWYIHVHIPLFINRFNRSSHLLLVQEALARASQHLGLNPHLKSLELHRVSCLIIILQIDPANILWFICSIRIYIYIVIETWSSCPCGNSNLLSLQIRSKFVEAWGESEAALQRSFLSYCMRRFQKNASARTD